MIKIQNQAIAYIGGSSKEDIEQLPDTAPRAAPIALAVSQAAEAMNAAAQPKLSVESIAALEAIHGESEQLDNKYFRN